jgi:hypothetical protein
MRIRPIDGRFDHVVLDVLVRPLVRKCQGQTVTHRVGEGLRRIGRGVAQILAGMALIAITLGNGAAAQGAPVAPATAPPAATSAAPAAASDVAASEESGPGAEAAAPTGEIADTAVGSPAATHATAVHVGHQHTPAARGFASPDRPAEATYASPLGQRAPPLG